MSDDDDIIPTPPSAAKAKRVKSRADDLLDGVQGIRPDKDVWVCRACGNNTYRTRTPLDAGISYRECRKCRRRVARASVRSRAPDALNPGAPANLISPVQNGQAVRGPFAGEIPPRQDPLRPQHRSKTERD